MLLSNVVGIVTGGASGLGAAAASSLIRRGAKVMVADLEHQHESFLRNIQQLASNSNKNLKLSLLENSNHDTMLLDAKNDTPVMAFSSVDVTQENQITTSLDRIETIFGQSVNTVVNCAGICPARKTISIKKQQQQQQQHNRNESNGHGNGNNNNHHQIIRVHPLKEFEQALMVNALGSFNVARLASERMVASPLPIMSYAESNNNSNNDGDNSNYSFNDGLRGCIINTASIAALEGQIGQVAYSASKGAVVSMTLPMARDLSSFGIRVMTIAPGLFQTPLLDGLPQTVKDELGATVPCPKRLGHPNEFGQLVISILENPMLNGEVIRLDGAIRMPP